MTDHLQTARGQAYDIVPEEGPLDIASDADLAARGFDRDVTFNGGVLQATSDWSTARGLSLLGAGAVIDTREHDVEMAGGVKGDGMLVKFGRGTLRLNGISTHPFTWVAAGALMIAGAHMGRITIGPAGILAGTGAVRDVDASAGTITPGADTPGILLAREVTMGPEHALVIRIAGLTAGRDHDRLDVRGTAAIQGATLMLRPTAPMSRRSRFTIVTNASGAFAGLPEGALIPTIFGMYEITYRGGPERRDVVVIAR
jgi:hypothetical protein